MPSTREERAMRKASSVPRERTIFPLRRTQAAYLLPL